MRAFVRHNSLSLFFLAIFIAALVGQALVGHVDFNDRQLAHGATTVDFWRYVTSSDFAADVMENWQSEYLQFSLFILGTIWLLQRGSPESKELHKAGRESEVDQKIGEHADQSSPLWARMGGMRTFVYSNSLLFVMAAIWLASWGAQWMAGHTAYNEERFSHDQPPVSLIGYLGSADFWNRTLQNWQSEFLAVGSMAILAVYLRQRGSPESKPVGSAHGATGAEG